MYSYKESKPWCLYFTKNKIIHIVIFINAMILNRIKDNLKAV